MSMDSPSSKTGNTNPISSKKSTYILYHSPCNDGFGAALAAWLKYEHNAIYLPVNYGIPLPNLDGAEEVFVLDFSYPREILVELSKKCKVTVLDHHITAEKQLSDLPFAIFDKKRSGAGLAWDYFHPGLQRPKLINLIEDRDLSVNQYQESHAAYVGLILLGEDFKEGAKLLLDDARADELITTGQIALKYQTKLINEVAKAAKKTSFLEFDNVMVVNCPISLMSDLADKLLTENKDAPFCALWHETKSGDIKWSLRAKDSGQDVSVICERFGGGGHKKAAAFLEKTKLNLTHRSDD